MHCENRYIEGKEITCPRDEKEALIGKNEITNYE